MMTFEKLKERAKRWEVGYLMKNGSWVTARYAIITFTGLAISVAFSRLVSQELYGQYQFVLTLISFLSLLSLPGLNLVSLRESVGGNDQILLRAVQKSFLWSWGISALSCLYAGYLFFTHQESLILPVILAGFLAPWYYAPNNWYVYYEGKKQFRASSLRIIVMQLSLCVVMIAALLSYPRSLSLLVTLYYLVPALLASYFFLEVRQIILKQKSSAVPQVLDMRLGLIATLQKYVSSFPDILMVFLVSFYFGFSSLAIYQVSNMVVLAIAGLVTSLLSLYFPHIVQGTKNLEWRYIARSILAGVPSTVLFVIFLKFFFPFLYGAEYSDSQSLGYALSGLVFLLPLKTYLINLFTAHKYNSLVIWATIFACGVLTVTFLLTHTLHFQVSLIFSLYALYLTLIGGLLVLGYFFSKGEKN